MILIELLGGSEISKKMLCLLFLHVVSIGLSASSPRAVVENGDTTDGLHEFASLIGQLGSVSGKLSCVTAKLISIEEAIMLVGIRVKDDTVSAVAVEGFSSDVSGALLAELISYIDQFSKVTYLLETQESVNTSIVRLCGNYQRFRVENVKPSLREDFREGKRICDLWFEESRELRGSVTILFESMSSIEARAQTVSLDVFNSVISARRELQIRLFRFSLVSATLAKRVANLRSSQVSQVYKTFKPPAKGEIGTIRKSLNDYLSSSVSLEPEAEVSGDHKTDDAILASVSRLSEIIEIGGFKAADIKSYLMICKNDSLSFSTIMLAEISILSIDAAQESSSGGGGGRANRCSRSAAEKVERSKTADKSAEDRGAQGPAIGNRVAADRGAPGIKQGSPLEQRNSLLSPNSQEFLASIPLRIENLKDSFGSLSESVRSDIFELRAAEIETGFIVFVDSSSQEGRLFSVNDSKSFPDNAGHLLNLASRINTNIESVFVTRQKSFEDISNVCSQLEKFPRREESTERIKNELLKYCKEFEVKTDVLRRLADEISQSLVISVSIERVHSARKRIEHRLIVESTRFSVFLLRLKSLAEASKAEQPNLPTLDSLSEQDVDRLISTLTDSIIRLPVLLEDEHKEKSQLRFIQAAKQCMQAILHTSKHINLNDLSQADVSFWVSSQDDEALNAVFDSASSVPIVNMALLALDSLRTQSHSEILTDFTRDTDLTKIWENVPASTIVNRIMELLVKLTKYVDRPERSEKYSKVAKQLKHLLDISNRRFSLHLSVYEKEDAIVANFQNHQSIAQTFITALNEQERR